VHKKEFHMNAWKGLNCFSEQSDIDDDEFSQNWNASLDKYGVVRFSGGGKKYGQNHPHTNTDFIPGGGLFAYSTDYVENIISSDFTVGHFVDYGVGYIKATPGTAVIELQNLSPSDSRYTIFNTPSYFDNMMIHIHKGPGKGQIRKIINWTGDGSDNDVGTSPRYATIDGAFGHKDHATTPITVSEIEGEDIRLKDVAKVRIWNTDIGVFGTKGLYASPEIGPEGFSTLIITDVIGRKLHLHFTDGDAATALAEPLMTSTTFEKCTSSDPASPFYGTDKVNTHYLINANNTAGVVVDNIVAAVTEATDGDNDYVHIAAVDCTTTASATNPAADVVLFKDDSGLGKGYCDIEYIGWFNKINMPGNSFEEYEEWWHGNPVAFNKSLDIYQPFTKGLGSTHVDDISKITVSGHQWQAGEYVSLKGITGKTAYNTTFRIEWVETDNIYVFTNGMGGSSSGGSIGFSSAQATTRVVQSGFTDKSYYKIYKWNFSPTGATSPWHQASSQTSALFSNVPHDETNTNLEVMIDSDTHTGTIFKKEIASSASPGLSPWNRIFTANTFIYSSGAPSAAVDAAQNKAVDLGYIEQTGIPLVPGESYQLSFDMNFLTSWKMWAADLGDSDILPGVLLYSPTAGSPDDVADGTERDLVLMSDNQWVRSNEPVSGDAIVPFSNIIRNGDFKEADVAHGDLAPYNYYALPDGSTDITNEDGDPGELGFWTVKAPTYPDTIDNSNRAFRYRLLKNEDAENVDYFGNDSTTPKSSVDGGFDGASCLAIRNSTTDLILGEDDLTEYYKTSYVYQNVQVDGGCWYDLYIKWDGGAWKDNSTIGLRYNVMCNEDVGIVQAGKSIIGGWSQKQHTSRRHSDDHLEYNSAITPIYRHIGQDAYINSNMTEADLRFEYQRFFVPEHTTTTNAVSIQIRISLDCVGSMHKQNRIFISAVSVKKSFPDLVHIAKENQENTYNKSLIPVLGVPKINGGEAFTSGIGSHGSYSRLDTVYNWGQFYDKWNTYKLNFTIPTDATNTRDYILRIYAGRFGYTSKTVVKANDSVIPDGNNASSRYPTMQAVCIDNIALGKKTGGTSEDIILMSDSIKPTSDVSGESSVYSYLTSGGIWNKGFLKWRFPKADTVYSYTNGILKMSDANFATNNNDVISYFYYNRPVLGNYDVSGHMLTDNPLDFIEDVTVTQFKDFNTIPVQIMGCHEDMWRGYRIESLNTFLDVPDVVSPAPLNWHYMQFDWKKTIISSYTDILQNLLNQKYLQNIPIKYVDITGQNLATRRMSNQTDSGGTESNGQFMFGGTISTGEDGAESTTIGHVYNNPVILPISGLVPRQYKGEDVQTSIGGAHHHPDIDLIGNTSTGELVPDDPAASLVRHYFSYPGLKEIPNPDFVPLQRGLPTTDDDTDVGDETILIPHPYSENGMCGGTTLTECLELQWSHASTPVAIEPTEPPGDFLGPRYMAAMEFDLILSAYGASRAESTGTIIGDDNDSVWREVLDCPIPKIKATLLRIPEGIEIGDNLLDGIFDGSLVLDDEICTQILPGTGKTLRQKKDEGGDDLFGYHDTEDGHTFSCHIPYRFNLGVPVGLDGNRSVLTSSDNMALKLEILDPKNSIGYLEAFIGTYPNSEPTGTAYHHSLGYNFSKWEARFYEQWKDSSLVSWNVSGQDISLNVDFKVPKDSNNQEILDTSESWTDRIFQVGCSTVNIFDEESAISVDENFNVGEDIKIESNQAPKIVLSTTDALLKHEAIKGINIYMKDNESDIWYLQASVDTFKGTIKSSTNGKEFPYTFRSYGQNGILATNYELPETYLLNFNEIDSYESKSLVSQEDGLVPSKLKCRYKTAVHCNNRLYVGNIEQDGRVYPDRMLKSPIGKYNVFPASSYIDVAINDGDEITHLSYYKDKILQFKRRKVFVLNISGDYEFLEDTFDYIGVSRGCQVTDTPYGIAWVNASGCFLYDGEKLTNLISNKIGTEGFQSNPVGTTTNFWMIGHKADDIPAIGYIASTSKLLVCRDVGSYEDTISSSIITSIPEAFEYSFQSEGWTFLYRKLTSPPNTQAYLKNTGQLSNFVNDANGQLLYYSVFASGDAAANVDSEGFSPIINGLYYWDDMPVRNQDALDEYNESPSDARVGATDQIGDFFYLRTKNFNFGSAHARKKIYKVYVTFKTSDDTERQNTVNDASPANEEVRDSRVNVYYATNGETPNVGTNTFLPSASTNYDSIRGLYASSDKSGNITAVADHAVGSHDNDILITSAAHGLVNDDEIYVTGTSDYNSNSQINGFHKITYVTDDTFYYEETFNGNQSGKWEKKGDAGWHIAELKPTNESDVNNIYSFQLVFQLAGGRIANRFEINDITILYRIKPPK